MTRLLLGGTEITHLCGGRFRLDGGAMFGVVPKPLWDRVAPADTDNRVALACNCLLLRTASGLTLVDTGLGTRFSEREQAIFSIDPNSVLTTALDRTGHLAENIDRVLLTHLHFDHCGGALTPTPQGLQATFPRAEYLVQRGEWDDARQGKSIMKSSYRPDDLDALAQSGRLRFLDGDTDLGEGISTFVTGGHTAHHQGVLVRAGGQTLAYPAELVPTRAHLRLYWNMAYDMAPYQTFQDKAAFLEEACRHDWIVAYDHDPETPWSRLQRMDRDYQATPVHG